MNKFLSKTLSNNPNRSPQSVCSLSPPACSEEHEGVLSVLKARMVCNEALMTRAMALPPQQVQQPQQGGAAGTAGLVYRRHVLGLERYLRAQPLDVTHFWACRSLEDDPTRRVEVGVGLGARVRAGLHHACLCVGPVCVSSRRCIVLGFIHIYPSSYPVPQVRGKRLADGVEALIGAVFVHCLNSAGSSGLRDEFFGR